MIASILYFVFMVGILLGNLNDYVSFFVMLKLGFLTTFIRFVFINADCDMVLMFYKYFGKSKEKLNDKVIWVTGASTGIGESIALALSHYKVKLVLSARSEDKLKEVKRKCLELGALDQSDILILPFDMTCHDKHQWAFSAVLNEFGKLDVLLSNAGRSQRAQWEKIETEVDKALFELNAFSLVNLARIVTSHFLLNGGGKHVVMSSVAGKVGSPFSGSYSASKHALMGYFESLRAEKGSKGVSVTMLCPGPVVSNLMDSIFTEKLGEKSDLTRSGKLMTSERCAHLSIVAMANDISEAWICFQPVLVFMYLNQYLPSLVQWFMNHFDFGSIALNFRDGSSSKQKSS